MGLRSVWIEDVDILVEEQLHKFGGLQKLPLAAQDAGSLLRRVEDAAAGQGENHHEGILQTGKEMYAPRRTCTSKQSHRHTQKQ